MKTRCKKPMLICTAAIVTPDWFVVAQDGKKNKNKHNVTIEDTELVHSELHNEKQQGAPVANLIYNRYVHGNSRNDSLNQGEPSPWYLS